MFIENKTEVSVLPWLPSNFYLIPSPFVGSSGGEAWRGFQNFHNSGRTYWVLLFSSLWGTHLAVWDLILSRCYHLAAALSLSSIFLSLDVVYLFWWVLESSFDGCWTTSLMLVFSQEEISACPNLALSPSLKELHHNIVDVTLTLSGVAPLTNQ